LKLRAWDKEFNLMSVVTRLDYWSEIVEMSDGELYIQKLEKVELMISTGLFDKKGAEIFEGDILAVLSKSGDELVYLYVIYKDGKFMAVENEEHGYTADLIDCTTYHSVVGNIYENAKLLGR
jgi:uncharacterized phage protein (TIGR01671 family)